MSLDDEPTGTTETSGTDTTSDAATTPAPATRTRRRAASRPAGPPAAPEGEETPAAEAPAEEKPAPRKRASRKKAVAAPVEAPVEAPVAEAVPEPVAEAAAETPAETPAEEAAPRRRRRAPKAAAAAAAVTEAEPVAAPAEAPVVAEAAAAPVAATEDETEEETEEAVAAAAAEAAVRPVFAMPLFQAPEPAAAPRTRRRAASRPAGPPAPVELTAPAEDTPAAEAEEAPAPARRTRRTRRVQAEEAAETLEVPVAAAADGDEAPAEDALEPHDDQTDADADVDPDDDESGDAARRRRRRRGGRGRRGRGPVAEDGEETDEDDAPAAEGDAESEDGDDADDDGATGSRRRRRRRRRGTSGTDAEGDDPPNTVVRVRESRRSSGGSSGDDVTSLRGSTRLEAKKQRRREGREAGRRRTTITEAEFLARRESVDRVMVVREREGRTQIGVLEDGVLVEHYVARRTQTSMVGNVYLGRVQNVLPSMEAAFVDVGKGRNAVLYAGEVNWDAAGLEGQPKRIEHALRSGESVLVQVTKDPIGHKGARLTSQISLPGRYLVYVPDGSMTGISRKLPDVERNRLKKILRDVVPENAGVIVRTAAEGASAEELERDVARLQAQWEDISRKAGAVNAPALLYGEPEVAIRVVRDIFNEDFSKLVISGDEAWDTLQGYIGHVAPDLVERLERADAGRDVFAEFRIDEQLAKALDRKVWLPSGGSLVIDRTEAMTVVDVNTGKFTGSGGNLEETVTKNNIEAAEEIVRQLRLRDIGGIIVVDFIDMVLESNRDLVLRRLLECLGRDRTKHQVAEVTSLGLVQMTRKRVGQGLLEVFSETCEHCGGRGLVMHDEPVEKRQDGGNGGGSGSGGSSSGGGRRGGGSGGGRGNGGNSGGGSSGGNAGGNGGNGNGGNSHAGNGNGGNGNAAAKGSGGSASLGWPDAPAVAAEAGTGAAEASAPSGEDAPATSSRRGRRGRGNRSASSPAGPPGGDPASAPSAVAGS